ncbi:SET domain-containing protein 9-like [Dendronephthya gigantea]|uniref:SET domain-containing protein 9-like n=1 Tax=Dendronephthya gigantea TaxID=151771 RepID=UPI00106A976C|nr:SET domain-containing protein 9-like [Dendronephthya gigantea]XP_028413395.1 SET domain-containing protein 9-like [Dendronephthya gigantea]
MLGWWKRLVESWNNYRYRFVPWIMVNMKNRHVRKVLGSSNDNVIPETVVLRTFEKYFNELEKHVTNKTISCEKIMTNALGFSITRSSSKVSGTGVVVSNGRVKKGSLVSIYPGTVYQSYEPIFFQSLANSFIFRCIDGILIDGKDTGLSRIIYRSCCQRDLVGEKFTCDMSWLTPNPHNLLAIGQYVNNATREFAANVSYQELNIPSSFPLQYLKYIPNVNYNFRTYKSEVIHVRIVVLVALRDIEQGEELFSSYFTVVC